MRIESNWIGILLVVICACIIWFTWDYIGWISFIPFIIFMYWLIRKVKNP